MYYHDQLSLACDAIIGKLAEQRPDLALAFLCTPTDCHVIPKEAHDAAKKNLKVRQDEPPMAVKGFVSEREHA